MASQYELSHSLSGGDGGRTGAHSGWGSTGDTFTFTEMSDVPTEGSINVRPRDTIGGAPTSGSGPSNLPSPGGGLTPSSSVGSFVSTDEKRPLVSKFLDLTRSLSQTGWDDSVEGSGGEGAPRQPSRRTLGWLGGVFASVALGQLSTNAFLRVGFVVGQAGLLQTLLQFLLAYLILYMTILSICAISTNGAVEGGGAYFMISRALGPEFGGSIGVLFFLANIISCALYVSGCVEGISENFGPGGTLAQFLPGGNRWWTYLYATCVLALCLIICLIGGSMFARTSIFILIIVVVCVLTVILSMFITAPFCVKFAQESYTPPAGNDTQNFTAPCGNYTGFDGNTFVDNLGSHYTKDYQSKDIMNFATVFAVLFSSVTGIMNGANMSGELKDPSKAIPRGTLSAAAFTFSIYVVLSVLTAATSTRPLLLNNYIFMQPINVWQPFIVIGIMAATLSAALGNLIGASRILEALAKDKLFWKLLNPATITTRGGNPIPAVLISWVLVQLVLLIGSLNAISPLASVFFLLSYAATNLACLGLELASAPNFRPTFKLFSWHTALAGFVSCMAMCFLINVIYASVSLSMCMVLIIVLHIRSFPTSWGSISQALIFHQVRKYLLMLDSRKDHVKFWRPQILLMVANPRAAIPLMDFVNDVKKGGLYVLGHVTVGSLDSYQEDPSGAEMPNWMNLIDYLKVKAFVEVTLATSVREGMHHLVRLSGLGGMKPNTIFLGFYDDSLPEDILVRKMAAGRAKRRVRFYGSEETPQVGHNSFPELRESDTQKHLSEDEYIMMVVDALKMNKNLVLCRHFHLWDKEAIMRSKKQQYIDVWPVNFFRPETSHQFDNTCLFMLQLACILNMVPGWKSRTTLRIFLCVNAQSDDTLRKERKLDQLLRQLRIIGQIKIVTWENVLELRGNGLTSETEVDAATSQTSPHTAIFPVDTPMEYVHGVNQLVKLQCSNTAITFIYLPKPPVPQQYHSLYLQQLRILTNELPPTVFVNGIHPVTSTTL